LHKCNLWWHYRNLLYHSHNGDKKINHHSLYGISFKICYITIFLVQKSEKRTIINDFEIGEQILWTNENKEIKIVINHFCINKTRCVWMHKCDIAFYEPFINNVQNSK
jgi:hypothetical protein